LEGLLEDGSDAQFLEQMRNELAMRKNIAGHIQQLRDKKREMHKADRETYDEKLLSLYDQARPSRDSNRDQKKSDEAYMQMIEEYPESYATAVVTAERALDSALKASPAEVESYYNLLVTNPHNSSVVTEQGVEALPSIQTYLVQQYMDSGREAEAEAIIQSLEQNSGDSLVAVPGPQGGPEWRPVSEVLQQFRETPKP
jgi:hypothetical protein